MKRIAIALGALILLGFGALAYASIPGGDGVIHSCYKTADPGQGIVFIVDSAASCPTGFTALNWNQTGPAGPAGAPGASGLAGYEVVTASTTWSATALNNDAAVNCSTGKKIIGGGGVAGGQENGNGSSRKAFIERSQPLFDGTNYVGWGVGAHRDYTTTEVSTTQAYAICVNIGS